MSIKLGFGESGKKSRFPVFFPGGGSGAASSARSANGSCRTTGVVPEPFVSPDAVVNGFPGEVEAVPMRAGMSGAPRETLALCRADDEP